MKVVGVGGPSWMRIRLGDGELALVVEQLRAQRERAARQAVAVHDHSGAGERDVDAAHDRLREVEAALMWLERAERDAGGRTWLLAGAPLLEETVRGVAERAIGALVAEHERFTGRDGDGARDGQRLLAAADLARDALTTLARFRDVDHGPPDPPYLGMT